MKPQKQLYMHDPDNGVYGDCFRTCIACLLEMPVESVPHFFDEEGAKYPEKAMMKYTHWLKIKGISRLAIAYNGCDIGDMQATLKALCNGFDGCLLLSGQSKKGINHVVVVKGGDIVHDPAQDCSGITGPCDDGHYWVEILIPYDLDKFLAEAGKK